MAVLARNQNHIAALPLLLHALFLVICVRLGLTFSSLDKIRLRFLPKSLDAPREAVDIERLAWAVRRIAERIPDASCLTRAQALQIMLSRRGISSQLVLGVLKSKNDAFRAHAWLLKDGEIVIGGPQKKVNAFSPISEYGPILP